MPQSAWDEAQAEGNKLWGKLSKDSETIESVAGHLILQGNQMSLVKCFKPWLESQGPVQEVWVKYINKSKMVGRTIRKARDLWKIKIVHSHHRNLDCDDLWFPQIAQWDKWQEWQFLS